ncbi:hypothetical protein HN695_05850 [Candidatus Woesearchaeota archaeon]|jgi:hypothetical protein|nr:hypothetical protein [Candidatus Woesearchaeota archaeon]MBT5272595.1 hypothetical protein [Candidatus Woesearchaeota archaeon]MBT6040548.1 hypothetical protein [Candidatus Woesearchaeota archaeon]MBT6337147.1 hypothetical protein [Candidatus Woesearchaeota archaeon]MBT7927833.1 hypothetical protein [Candidatus Woesearchaeota archaeon]
MIEFNPDGSLKVPGQVAEKKQQDTSKMQNTRCLEIRREIISFTSPKKCKLFLKLSERLTDNRFVENLYKYFQSESEVPTKIIKINEKEFEVEIGTCFRRCSDCNSLINKYKDFMDGCVIEHKGSCSYQPNKNFCYEDYFD